MDNSLEHPPRPGTDTFRSHRWIHLQGLASTPNATPEHAEKEFFEKHRPTSLIQRMAEESEVASLVAYLASPLAAATNGSAVRCEGGILRAIF
jgi:NAD(P)-dependent dehydrogenase (short-subunit alcohol dehydrogenase family)